MKLTRNCAEVGIVMNMLPRTVAGAGALVALCMGVVNVRPAVAGESAHSIYTRALTRERQLRHSVSASTLAQFRSNLRIYELVVRRYPRSGYCDNALWQAGNLALLAFERFDEPADRKTAVRLLTQLKDNYPSSSLAARAAQLLQELEATRVETSPASSTSRAPTPEVVDPDPVLVSAPLAERPALKSSVTGTGAGRVTTIRDIKRTSLPDGIRVSIEMDGESFFRAEQLNNPRRVFFDVRSARAIPALQDKTLKYSDDIVREIRLGRHPNQTTRVVMDMEAVEGYTVFTLYNPFRVIVDFRRASAVTNAAPLPEADDVVPPVLSDFPETKPIPASKEPVPLITRPAVPPMVPPAAPIANSNGQFSMARQLGLGISRIVLDPGHGGHDPGARANGLSEAELVLDVTLRLRALLEKQPGMEVTLTRDSDVFVPLEERTAMATRQSADLFLSIHANASRNLKARGVETYFLNFANNPEAEAVAARENFGSNKAMRNLPDIVRAIALNNKINESRDFADTVQKAMVRRLSARESQVKDLGVKQAPFVVLIGAGMPSVLAEISFVTNKQEAALLKTGAYRQQIAEALSDAIVRYQRSLKGVRAIAARE